MSDQQLVNLCITKDRRGQKSLYDKYSGQMYSICLRYCSSPDAAADALQNGFIKVFKNIEKYNSSGSLGAWIRKIVINSALDEIRKEKRNMFFDLEKFDDSKKLSVELDYREDPFDYNRILSILNTLPQGYKTIFSMYVFDELNHSEISEALNISESTSRSQLLRARKMMQERIKVDAYLVEEYLTKNKTYIA